MAENLAFDQGFGDGRTVDGHKRFVLARTEVMDAARHQLLARATLAGDQYGSG